MLFLPSSEHVIILYLYLFYITDYIFVHDIFCKSIGNETDFGGHMV